MEEYDLVIKWNLSLSHGIE